MASVDQVESIIKELKKKGFSDMEIFCFMVKTEEIPGKDWKKEVVIPIETYHAFMLLLIKHVA